MKIGLIDVDSKMPNLALMKISAYHKTQGDSVKWHDPNDTPDRVYASKIFNYTTDYETWPDCETIKGGTGYYIKSKLPGEIESIRPDYSIYPNCKYALGFMTRGCPNKCPWCIVPEKEGKIKFINSWFGIKRLGCRDIVFMDNNILASRDGIKQLEHLSYYNKSLKRGSKIRIDFNQGIDASLITNETAKLLASLLWFKPLRLACDNKGQIPIVKRAVQKLRSYNCTPKKYFCYVLVRNVQDALKCVEFLRSINVDPFAQPYRDPRDPNHTPSIEQLAFARWVNKKQIFKSTTWEKYKYNPKNQKNKEV